MPSSDLIKEAERIMTICNACRYCEGFCAVFPAMEMRRAFSEQDLKYLANLCHNCRDCYYACQYAPPHEFALNVPRALAELRLDTYSEFCWPPAFKGLFQRNGLVVSLAVLLSVVTVLLLTLLVRGSEVVFGIHTGPGAFYQVIPYMAIVLPFSALAVFILLSIGNGVANLWRETGGSSPQLFDLRANLQAAGDGMRLKYLDGGGHGCNDPDERFSMIRRYFHHATFYGFMLCLASTSTAAVYDHFLHLPTPYPVSSWPVVLGIVGGIALLIGTGGMLYLKWRLDKKPAASRLLGMDLSFTLLLFLTGLTGLLVLVLRAMPFMGTLLALHLGVVMRLFITLPYGKFIHAAYRYAALIRNAIEQLQDKS